MTEQETKPKTKKSTRKEVKMNEARSSWNTAYLSPEGFECQITLRDEDENVLRERIASVVAGIAEAGGIPLRRRAFEPENSNSSHNGEPTQEKTYVDGNGVRRCNLKLDNGRCCNTVVVERDGKYGRFWSCSNYKEHAMAS
ncbi:MAG: hypothetical protein ABIH46_08960 [Chloroflexota bacterium]